MDFMGLIEIPRVDNVRIEYQQFSENSSNQIKTESVEGSLCLTSHHLIFSPKNPADMKNKEIWVIHLFLKSIIFNCFSTCCF